MASSGHTDGGEWLDEPIPDRSEQSLSAIAVADALKGLRAEHRETIEETNLRGRSFDEAARILDVSAGTVKSRVYQALRALRRTLMEEG